MIRSTPTVPLPSGSAVAPCFRGSQSSLPKGSGTAGALKAVSDLSTEHNCIRRTR